MKVSGLASIALLAASVYADNCKTGLDYCGKSLIKKGDYRGQIKQALYAAGVDVNSNYDNMLFKCLGFNDGLVEYKKSCKSCVDSGKDRSDKCQ